jgi:HD-like signal output (HDOD) protein
MFDIDDERAKEIIDRFRVPPKPDVLTELQYEQAKPDPDITAFADIIAKDVALSANVLKTINSPVYGLQRTITDIKQSVILLGFKNVSLLASYFLLKQTFNRNSSISHEKYWDTALQTANMMSLIIQHMNLASECPIEDAYSFGLFRDCGIPLMALKFEDYKETLMLANLNLTSVFTDFEDKKYNTNHAVVGYFVASSWNLPKPLCNLILRHHEIGFLDTSDAIGREKTLYALVKIASNVLSMHKFMTEDSEWLLSKEPVLEYFGLTEYEYGVLEQDLLEDFAIEFG